MEQIMYAAIKAIEYYLPENILTNEKLAHDFPNWSAEKILAKTGIIERHIAGANEKASDLADKAAEKLFASGICERKDIDFLLLCTQSPDYFLPTTACIYKTDLDYQQHAERLILTWDVLGTFTACRWQKVWLKAGRLKMYC